MRRVCSLIVAVAAVILGLTAAVVAAESSKGAGVVTAVAGLVTVKREELSQPLRFRDPLYWRDVVEARKDGIARFLLGGKTTVTMRELSRLELRVEAQADGVRYTVELVAGTVRASVARVLMRPGEQVEVRTRNAVASVRGTDFIVETAERPAHRAFGLLGAREVAQGVIGSDSRTHETIVTTLSGVVDVSSRLAGTGRVERVRAYEAVRVSGGSEPVRLQIQAERASTAGSMEPVRTVPGELLLSLGVVLSQLLLAIAAAAAATAYARRGQGWSSRSPHHPSDERRTGVGLHQIQSKYNRN